MSVHHWPLGCVYLCVIECFCECYRWWKLVFSSFTPFLQASNPQILFKPSSLHFPAFYHLFTSPMLVCTNLVSAISCCFVPLTPTDSISFFLHFYNFVSTIFTRDFSSWSLFSSSSLLVPSPLSYSYSYFIREDFQTAYEMATEEADPRGYQFTPQVRAHAILPMLFSSSFSCTFSQHPCLYFCYSLYSSIHFSALHFSFKWYSCSFSPSPSKFIPSPIQPMSFPSLRMPVLLI